MEKNLKDLPECTRLTEEEKCTFDCMFKGFRSVKKQFARKSPKTCVSEVIKAHEDNTDSDDDVEVLKSIRI